MKSQKYFNNFICLTILLLIFVLRTDIDSYLSKMWLGNLLETIHEATDYSTKTFDLVKYALNALLTVCLVLGTSNFAIAIYHADFEFKRLCFLITCLMYFGLPSEKWNYPDTFMPGLTFDILICILLFILIIICIAKFMGEVFDNSNVSKDDKKGYRMNELYEDEKVNTGWNTYIKGLLNLMPESRLKKENLAIAITGAWGTGKTMFFDELKEEIQSKYIILDLKPWECMSADVIIKTYFAQLSNEFSSDKTLGNMLEHYSNILIDADIHPTLTKAIEYLSGSKECTDIVKIKKEINEKLSKNDKPLAVFIDDLDRLNGDELLEVLRLIRVSADFCNVIYFVAYDRGYVSKMLNAKNIDNGNLFLQKIFHMEITLPVHEKYMYEDVFIDNACRMLNNINPAELAELNTSLRQLFRGSIDIQFSDYIQNFRQANRFSNIFALNLQIIKQTENPYSIDDFICIELVHFVYPKLYDILSKSPLSILHLEKDIFIYKGNDDIDKDNRQTFLLKKIFPDYNTVIGTSGEHICCLLNYDNYFFLRTPEGNINIRDFASAINSKNEPDLKKLLNEWLKNNKTIQSLYQHLKFYPINQYFVELHNYFYCILYMMRRVRFSSDNVKDIIYNKFKVDLQTQKRYSGDIKNLIKSFCQEDNYIRNEYIYLLKYLIVPTIRQEIEEREGDLEKNSIISNIDIEELSHYMFARTFNQENQPEIYDITDINKPINNFIKEGTYIVTIDYINAQETIIKYDNFFFNSLLELYRDNKANGDDFNIFIHPIKEYASDYMTQEIDYSYINPIFGNYENFKKFIEECFVECPDRDNFLKKINK